mmetsp:Transcript_10829/g.66909  ORF Transcript_10829/g.66909 Transcript_10829/m.66909 type:complete len:208 (-) Transcript_10829:395-1018(-)
MQLIVQVIFKLSLGYAGVPIRISVCHHRLEQDSGVFLSAIQLWFKEVPHFFQIQLLVPVLVSPFPKDESSFRPPIRVGQIVAIHGRTQRFGAIWMHPIILFCMVVVFQLRVFGEGALLVLVHFVVCFDFSGGCSPMRFHVLFPRHRFMFDIHFFVVLLVPDVHLGPSNLFLSPVFLYVDLVIVDPVHKLLHGHFPVPVLVYAWEHFT